MSMKPLVTIAGADIPDPSEYESTTSTIVDSARNAEGYVVGSVIRDDVAKISMKWNFISAQDWADIMSLFSEANGGSFTNNVTFFLQDTNSWETRELYVGDRKAKIFLRNDDGSIKGYQSASLSLIEV